jgi:hypothetical protein
MVSSFTYLKSGPTIHFISSSKIVKSGPTIHFISYSKIVKSGPTIHFISSSKIVQFTQKIAPAALLAQVSQQLNAHFSCGADIDGAMIE